MTEQITMLIYCRTSSEATKIHGRADSFLFPFKPTSLDSAVSPSACGQISLSLSPAEGHFCRRNAARNDSCVHFK